MQHQHLKNHKVIGTSKMRANEFITEQPVTTTNAQGVTTTVNKAANRVTQQSGAGTVVKDRTGNMRSITTPKIGGFQAKQTFRPDATPGYGQATYTQGPTTLDIKGSPETGYTQTAKTSVGGVNMQAKQRYSGQKEFGASATLANNKKISATSTISKPGAKPVTKMSISEFEDVQAAIREHVAKRVPFTECMFRPGSTAFTEFYRQVRECADKLNLDWEDQELIATDIGECIMVEGEMVALDVPMIEEELDERKENPFQMDMTAYDFPTDKDNSKYVDPDDPDREHNKKTVSIQAQLRKSVSMNGQKEVEFINGKTVKVPGNVAEIVLSKINQVSTTQDKFKIIKYISQSYENLINFAKNDISEAEYQGRNVKLNSPKRGGPKKFYVYTKNKKGNVIKVSWGDAKTGLKVKANDRGAVKSFVARHKCKQANDKTTARYWSCRTPRYKALGVKGGQWW